MGMSLIERLRWERNEKFQGGIYHKIQVLFSYNSNHIEGSRLSEEQTRHIFMTNSIDTSGDTFIKVDDIIEVKNHFKALDFILDQIDADLSQALIKKLHAILKQGTSDADKPWFNVGSYKCFPNEVGGIVTTDPEQVETDIEKLLQDYDVAKTDHSLEEMLDFHVRFERIHPFQDGNGRVGRLILFKECLRNNIVPFIITDELKFFYYRGLSEWDERNGFLLDTCLNAQDTFKKYMEYFKI